MTRTEQIQLEIVIYETIEREKIKTGAELTDFAIDLHDLIETVVFEYGMDEEIYEDYEPSY